MGRRNRSQRYIAAKCQRQYHRRETAMKSFRCGESVKIIEAGADGHTISIDRKSLSGLRREHSKWPHCRGFFDMIYRKSSTMRQGQIYLSSIRGKRIGMET